ncbi:hypothetical protein LBMAG53_07390 [Planctomycetota bacterium]|nr:hypothetical protein LBMAG53_07390 [Planctomycetota bacterium]
MPNPDANPLRRLPGWALLLIAVGLVLFIAVVTVATWAWASHRAGQLEWQETVAELESKGFACSPQSYVKMHQIEVDEDLLGQYQAWEARANSLSYFDDPGLTWLDGGHGSERHLDNWWGASPPEKLAKILADGKPLLDDLTPLLRSDKLQISEFPGLRQALASNTSFLTERVAGIWIPSLLAIRGAATLLGHRVLVGEAVPALRDLDLLHQSLSHGLTLIAAMVNMAESDIRDGAWLGAVVHQRIDPALARQWIEESDVWVGRTGKAMRHELGVFTGALMQDVDSLRGINALRMLTGDRMTNVARLGFFSFVRAHHLAAKHAHEFYRVAAAMESSRWEDYDRTLFKEIIASNTLLSIAVPNLPESFITAWETDLHARLVRTAARIVIAHDQSGILPADEPALTVAGVLLPTMPMTTGRIRYERLGDHRFRVCADPAGPFPDPELSKRTAMHNDFGKAASSDLLVNKKGSIEIDLAGLRAAKR